MTGLRILLADDDEDVRDSLTTLLRISGFHVHATSGGHAALAELGAARYDVALLDVSMPEISGYEIALAMRGWSADRRPFLVAMTGWGREADRERALVCGFDRHMVKPVALDDLKDLFASVPARGPDVSRT